MNNLLLNLYVKFQSLKDSEEGQDLVEYAMLLALIALVAVIAVGSLGNAISTLFNNVTSSAPFKS